MLNGGELFLPTSGNAIFECKKNSKFLVFLFQKANDGLMKIRIACTLNEQKKLTLQKKDAMHTSDGEIINIGADFIGQILAIIIGKPGFQFVADFLSQSYPLQ